MANEDHLKMLREDGVEIWNAWRVHNSEIKIDLSKADLSHADLREAKLYAANLNGAVLTGANLIQANLTAADLRGALLTEANLSEAALQDACLASAQLDFAILREADLDNANLQGASLIGANLKEARLSNANLVAAKLNEVCLTEGILENANLKNADLTNAALQGANLCNANLKGAVFTRANLQEINLCKANLQEANLDSTNMQNSNLEFANLKMAKFNYANLQGANLLGANLQSAVLIEANFARATLHNANLQDADVRGTHNLQLDATFIRNTRFSPHAKDPWSVLRRTYTGPKLTFQLIALIAFALPYVGKAAFWAFVNRGQGHTQGLLENIKQRAVEQGIDDQTITTLWLSSEKIKSLSQCLNSECEERSVWQLLFGVDQSGLFWLLPLILVIYNILRGFLTYLVAPMRDEEERSGYSPDWKGKKWEKLDPMPHVFPGWLTSLSKFISPWLEQYLMNQVSPWLQSDLHHLQGYRLLYYTHLVVFVLGFVAVAAFALNAWHWLGQPIYLPV